MDSFLSTVEPFIHLPRDARSRLSQASLEISCAKGETLFKQGEAPDHVWVLKSGRVHLMNFFANGKASTICVMAPGELFCCVSALDKGDYPADAVALEDSVVVRIPSSSFYRALNAYPAFMHGMICLTCSRMRQIAYRGCTIFDPAEKRLAQILIGLSGKFGRTIPLTRQDLSEIAGITPETAIRILSRFDRQGLTCSSRGKIEILDPRRLKAVSGLPDRT